MIITDKIDGFVLQYEKGSDDFWVRLIKNESICSDLECLVPVTSLDLNELPYLQDGAYFVLYVGYDIINDARVAKTQIVFNKEKFTEDDFIQSSVLSKQLYDHIQTLVI